MARSKSRRHRKQRGQFGQEKECGESGNKHYSEKRAAKHEGKRGSRKQRYEATERWVPQRYEESCRNHSRVLFRVHRA